MRPLIVAMLCVGGVTLAASSIPAPCHAQTATSGAVVVTLTDGSTLKGELLGAQADRLEVKSSMGTLRIPLSRVASVARDIDGPPARGGAAAGAGSAGAGGAMGEAIAGMRSQLTANPATLQKLMALSDDADIMALVLDPEVQRIIQSNDLDAAARSEKVKRLMAHPEIQAIVRDFQAKHTR